MSSAQSKKWNPVPTISALPNLAVMDEVVEIVVNGLQPNSPVTVSTYVMYKGSVYTAFAHFYANKDGDLKVSLGGTYVGRLSMGLFTSMLPFYNRNAGTRFLLTGPADTIFQYRVYVWRGFMTADELYQIQRIPIKVTHNDTPIRGTLFLPRGKGPFPGVIDMFGGAGGCIELRAALLAKQGFATLALAYFAYDDLPAKTAMDFSMNYFEQAVDWFVHQSEVQPGGIGMVGVCLGSQITLLMAIREPRIRAAVCINQSLFMICDPELRGNPMRAVNPKTMEHYPSTGIHCVVDGRLHAPVPCDMAKIRHPQFKSTFDNHILFIIGGDEQRMCPEKTIPDVIEHLNKTGRKNVKMEVIEGQGHLIEPPYSPLCVESRDGSTTVNVESYENVHPGLLILSNLISDWGGKRDTHEVQQMKAWTMLVNFLKQRLFSDTAKL